MKQVPDQPGQDLRVNKQGSNPSGKDNRNRVVEAP